MGVVSHTSSTMKYLIALAFLAVAPMLAGTAALMACTALPPLLIAHLLPRRPSSLRWLPPSSVMEPPALEAAAPMLAGTAALMACTVLPPLLTAHLLPRGPSSQRWLPPSSVMELLALEAAAPMLAGTAALMACTALPPPLTVHLLSIISISLQPSTIKKN